MNVPSMLYGLAGWHDLEKHSGSVNQDFPSTTVKEKEDKSPQSGTSTVIFSF